MFPRRLSFAVCFVGLCLSIATYLQAEEPALARSVKQAHEELWKRFVDRYGIVQDFAGELPTPEDCALGRPNAIGWWSPIENGPMFTGLYLPAVCERARRSGDPADQGAVRKLAQGLLKCASISEVAGFIARGVGTDGVCHYPLGSDDQTHPWFYGLHAYFKSDIPTQEERHEIAAKMKEVADVLESTGWRCPCDGAFKGQFRGGFRGRLFRDACRYLFMLRAMYDVTADQVWLDRYHKALDERPAGGAKTRMEICAEGYAADREEIKRLDDFQLWIYVGSQASLARLSVMETEEIVRKSYRKGLVQNSKNALAGIKTCEEFNNDDAKVFGSANWRAVYSTWYPQRTQEDAMKLAQTGDNALRGERKAYEARFMQNPLAAVAIVALAGDDGRDSVERAITHYDYSRLHLATFFFAECAFYALPQ